MKVAEFARKHPQPLLAIGLWLGFAISAAVSFNIVTYENGQPAAWYATSFLACGLLLLKGRTRPIFAAACLVTLPLIIIATPEWPWYGALLLTGLAALEAFLAATLTRRLSKTPRIANVKQLGRLLALAVLPACLVTIVCAASITKLLGHPFGQTLGQGMASHFMGLGSMLPSLLLFATPNLVKAPRKGWIEKVLLFLVLAAFASAPFTPLRYGTFLLIFPMATVLAFRMGAKQTAAIILFLTTLSLVVNYLEPGAGSAGPPVSVSITILIGQLYTMAVVYNGLFTALAVNHQARIKRHLERRTEISRRARARALQASRAKTDFLATMSHEIRTPMNGIIGFTQVLLRRPNLEPEIFRQLTLIDSSSAALLTVVNDILDFSKVEAGKVRLAPERVHLASIAQDALAIVTPEADRKGLMLSFEVRGDAEQTHMIDGERLRQVLLNLLNNAVKFTGKGEVALVLEFEANRARFAVKDTGVGIAPEAMDRLFQRFSQVDGSVTRTYGGTGLGLAISKGLIQLMGGRIGVDSRVGEGSTFWFEAPLSDAQPIAPAKVEASQDAQAAAAHVLLVDDHPVNRQLGRTMLGMLGCTCDEAENGEQAVEAMKAGDYDLVLMDIHMPVMDGLAATRAIRALGGKAGATPIVAVTADMLPECIEKCMAVGMAEHMGKPLTLEALIACMNRRLGAARGGALAA